MPIISIVINIRFLQGTHCDSSSPIKLCPAKSGRGVRISLKLAIEDVTPYSNSDQ